MRIGLICVAGAAALQLRPTHTALRPALRSGAVRALVGPELADATHAAVHHSVPAFSALADVATQVGVQPDGTRLTEQGLKALTEDGLGWWGTYIKTVEDGIFALYDTLDKRGVPFPYGLSILTFVFGVKLLTLPLNYNQLSSAAQVKAIKPQQDRIKTWYGDNKDLLTMETGNLFESQNVNPLAGCLPSLAQIPVFLGVYYSVTAIAKAKIFTEGFLWIPSLSGPIADRREGLSWLTEGWVDGVPKLGWEDTLCYLTLPVILVCTQTISLYLLGTFETLDASDDPSTKNTGALLRFLPFMLGWFAMNAPAGLGLCARDIAPRSLLTQGCREHRESARATRTPLPRVGTRVRYWVFNNMFTTLSTVTVKKLVQKDEISIPVDLAAVGPRRAPQPVPDGYALPDWVESKKAALKAEAEGTDGAGAEAKVEPAEPVEAAGVVTVVDTDVVS